jgi:hypothetical protein
MYKNYSIVLELRGILKNRVSTAEIEWNICKTVLQRGGWALPRYFLYTHLLKKNPLLKLTNVAGQRPGKHFPVARNTYATIQVLLEGGVFYVIRVVAGIQYVVEGSNSLSRHQLRLCCLSICKGSTLNCVSMLNVPPSGGSRKLE